MSQFQQPPNQPPSYQEQPQLPIPPEQPSAPKKRRGWPWIVGAIILVVIVIGVIAGFAISRGGTKWTTTHSLTDTGNVRTDMITVPDDWKITWQCYPEQAAYDVRVDVYNSSGILVSTAINGVCRAADLTTGTTSGEYEMHIGGQVFLSVQSEGSWTVTVQELK